MRNLAYGHGFVYNMGGEHVEGFTSMLWVLIGSFFYLFTSKPQEALLVFNIILMTLAIWRACLFADSYFKDRRMISPYSIIISGFILLIPGYVPWCTIVLMETGLWSCVLVFLFLGILQNYLERRNNFTSIYIILILLLLTRPEAYLWGLIAISVQYFTLYFQHNRSFKNGLRPTAISLLIFLGTIGALTLFRMIYFGYPFPNTYYAKVSADQHSNLLEGKKYIQQYFKYYTPHIFLPIISVGLSIFVFIWSRKKGLILFVFPVIIAVTYLIPLYTGGDHFGLFRFIQPYIPFFSVFYVLAFFTLFPLKKWIWYVPVTASLIGIFFSCKMNFNNFIKNKNNIEIEFLIAQGETEYATDLNEFLKHQDPLPTYGVFVAGASAYTYKGNSIDLLGLNNIRMAHSSPIKTGLKNHGSFNKKVFYEQMPDLFFCTRVYRDSSEFDMQDLETFKNDGFIKDLFKGLMMEKKFNETYFPVFIFSKKDSRVLQTHTHQRFLDKLNTSVYWYERILLN